VLLDEVVLRKPMGGSRVMLSQLTLLTDLMTGGLIRVRVTPLDRPTPLSFFGPFMILEFGEPENAVVYREIPSSTDEIIHAATEVDRHRTLFERAWTAHALDEAASVELIQSIGRAYS
jgi:hypothetical protein